MNGYHVGIGLNRVDPAHYGGWDGHLNACVMDAKAMHEITVRRGYACELLLDEAATADALTFALQNAADAALPGELVVISDSSHGGEIPNTFGGSDPTWCLFDRQFLVAELRYCLAQFAAGVRILVVSDSCHAERIVRGLPAGAPKAMPADVARNTHDAHFGLYEGLRDLAVPEVRASVISLTACRADQLALDGDRNGAFTAALLETLGDGFDGTYQQFLNEIRAKMPSTQEPQFHRVGPHDAQFLNAIPFKV